MYSISLPLFRLLKPFLLSFLPLLTPFPRPFCSSGSSDVEMHILLYNVLTITQFPPPNNLNTINTLYFFFDLFPSLFYASPLYFSFSRSGLVRGVFLPAPFPSSVTMNIYILSCIYLYH